MLANAPSSLSDQELVNRPVRVHPCNCMIFTQGACSSMFVTTGTGFIAQAEAAGPWSQNHCHGGAVAALIAHVGAQLPTRSPMQLARLTIDLQAPVPLKQELVAHSGFKRTDTRHKHRLLS